MPRPLGENIQREWDAEPLAVELWDELGVVKRDRETGLATLTDLARRGSSLAMMYLGCDHLKGSASGDLALGEEWLMRSADAGSIEGRLQLATNGKSAGMKPKPN